MARPTKSRKVCRLPLCDRFRGREHPGDGIVLSVEEYETIRLIDYMGFSQEECARKMEASRTTIQALYTEARKKMARFLIEGTSLKIEGGNYMLCDNQCLGEMSCGYKTRNLKGVQSMKIAVTYENGQVFQHFGHTEQFKIYNVENGQVVSSEVVSTNGQGHGALGGFLAAAGVDVLICGGIGGGAKNALAAAGIQLFGGAYGNADMQVAAFLAGNLMYNPNVHCNHHGHDEGHNCGDHHHEGGHNCGGHGGNCGSHGCH